MTQATEQQPFEFDGQPAATIGELLDAAMLAQRNGRAAEFLAAYRAYNPFADANLGYIFGYVEPPERRRELYAAFNLSHPVLGGRP